MRLTRRVFQLLEARFGPFDAVLGASFSHRKTILAVMRPFRALLEPPWAVFEACWAMLAALVAFLGRLGSLGESQRGAMAAQGPSGGGAMHATVCG